MPTNMFRRSLHPAANLGDGLLDSAEPTCGQVRLEAADPVEHVVHAAAGGLLHDRLELLPLAERVEDRRDGAELERVGAEEHQVVEDPVQLGEQGARPDRSLGHLHAEHLLDAEDHAELVGERGQPVVPVGQDEDLAVVADLEELLGAAVHVADDRLGPQDALAVEDDPQPQHAVGRGVLRADVEGHVGRGQPGRPDAHGDLASARNGGPVGRRGHGGQSAVCEQLASAVLARDVRRAGARRRTRPAAVREVTPVLVKMLLRCRATVFSLRKSPAATCGLLRPRRDEPEHLDLTGAQPVGQPTVPQRRAASLPPGGVPSSAKARWATASSDVAESALPIALKASATAPWTRAAS